MKSMGFEKLKRPKRKQEAEFEMETGDEANHRQSRASGSRRTRSQVAPDWSAQESLILVNEINAVEGDCLDTLSSFQKWKIIVENCNALEVHRSLNQCKMKWDSLLADYKKILVWEMVIRSGSELSSYWDLGKEQKRELDLPENFDAEVFQAIDGHLTSQDGGAGTDLDSDPEAIEPNSFTVFAESESKKQNCKLPLQKHRLEDRAKARDKYRSGKMKTRKCDLDVEVETTTEIINEKIPTRRSNLVLQKEQMMAAKLRENAELIKSILAGNLNADRGHESSDLRNAWASEIEKARRQGDMIIACFGNIADTLNQLCDMIQE